MNFEGRYTLPVPQRAAWDALNDPAVLKAAIAGCERFETIDANTWLAVVRASVGPISVTFRARLTVSDAQPPHRYTLTGEGQGGAAGHARLRAQIELAPGTDGISTLLSYAAQAEVGGKIASLGSRLMQSVVRRHTDAFFEALTAQLRSGDGVLPQAQAGRIETTQAVGEASDPSIPTTTLKSIGAAPERMAADASAGTRAADTGAPAVEQRSPSSHPLAASAPAWLVVFGTAVGIALGYCLGLLSR
jgi:carbon monoxide dehydrogenase subunit G